MPAIQADEALFLLRAALLPEIQNEHRLTRRVIEAIPADKADYRPDGVGRTALELAWHIVSAEHRFLDGVVKGRFDYAGAARPEAVQSPTDTGAWYGAELERDLEGLARLSGDQLLKVLDFRSILQLPAIAYLRAGINHSIHHRGQLTMYLRPMGARVPSIYGESYDDAQARKASRA